MQASTTQWRRWRDVLVGLALGAGLTLALVKATAGPRDPILTLAPSPTCHLVQAYMQDGETASTEVIHYTLNCRRATPAPMR